MAEQFAALKRAIAEDGICPSECWGNDEPRCPHCGAETRVSDNGWWKLYEEGEHEVSCPSCGGDFIVHTRVSFSFTFSFSTDTQEGLDEDESDGGSLPQRGDHA